MPEMREARPNQAGPNWLLFHAGFVNRTIAGYRPAQSAAENASSNAFPSRQQSRSPRQCIERMVAHEIAWAQRSPKPLLKTADAQAATVWDHARSFPDFGFDRVDLGMLIKGLRDALGFPN